MKTIGYAISAPLLVAAASAMASAPGGAASGARITGDYVEARTCNVYTGACHANGEAVTAGREAVLAWQVRGGSFGGIDLSGLRAVAVVTSSENLGMPAAPRTAVLYMDCRASSAQREALHNALVARCGSALGAVVAVESAPVEFACDGRYYTVRVPGVAYVRTERFDCAACVMPHEVWYQPFVPLTTSMVAKAAVNEFKGDRALDTTWRQVDQNSSYVGAFAL